MGIVIDHEKRKKVILKKALDVIIDEGYEDATFQKIADRCGITQHPWWTLKGWRYFAVPLS